jgi:uncharacterized protein (TIGR00251 family)
VSGATAFWQWKDETLFLLLHVQPGARQDALLGEHGGRLRVRVAAAPVDGAANDRLRRLLAEAFGVARAAVSIDSGQSGRLKTASVRAPMQLPSGLGIRPRA